MCIRDRSIGSSLPQFYIQFGSSSTWTWHVPRNRSGPRKYLCGVVGCFRDEKPPLREVEPPEPPEQSRDLRRPLPQPRPPAAPNNKPRPSQSQFCIPLCFPNHTSTYQVTTSLRTSITASPPLLPAWGFGAALAHPRYPKSDSLRAGAGKNNLPVATALRGRRLPSLPSLVANGRF